MLSIVSKQPITLAEMKWSQPTTISHPSLSTPMTSAFREHPGEQNQGQPANFYTNPQMHLSPDKQIMLRISVAEMDSSDNITLVSFQVIYFSSWAGSTDLFQNEHFFFLLSFFFSFSLSFYPFLSFPFFLPPSLPPTIPGGGIEPPSWPYRNATNPIVSQQELQNEHFLFLEGLFHFAQNFI